MCPDAAYRAVKSDHANRIMLRQLSNEKVTSLFDKLELWAGHATALVEHEAQRYGSPHLVSNHRRTKRYQAFCWTSSKRIQIVFRNTLEGEVVR
jgi:hypothetical protein